MESSQRSRDIVDCNFKVLVLGDRGSGKTSFCIRAQGQDPFSGSTDFTGSSMTTASPAHTRASAVTGETLNIPKSPSAALHSSQSPPSMKAPSADFYASNVYVWAEAGAFKYATVNPELTAVPAVTSPMHDGSAFDPTSVKKYLTYQLDMWDIAGDATPSSRKTLHRVYFQGAAAAVIVLDSDQLMRSLDGVKESTTQWIESLSVLSYAPGEYGSSTQLSRGTKDSYCPVPCVVLLNKADKYGTEPSFITHLEMFKKFCLESLHLDGFSAMSVRNGMNVDASLTMLAEIISKDVDLQSVAQNCGPRSSTRRSIRLDGLGEDSEEQRAVPKRKKCTC